MSFEDPIVGRVAAALVKMGAGTAEVMAATGVSLSDANLVVQAVADDFYSREYVDTHPVVNPALLMRSVVWLAGGLGSFDEALKTLGVSPGDLEVALRTLESRAEAGRSAAHRRQAIEAAFASAGYGDGS